MPKLFKKGERPYRSLAEVVRIKENIGSVSETTLRIYNDSVITPIKNIEAINIIESIVKKFPQLKKSYEAKGLIG